jgi:hypothetical protein
MKTYALLVLLSVLLFKTNLIHAAPEDYLPPETIQAMAEANQKGLYRIRLLEKEIEGQKRLVVLLGEVHVRTLQEKEVGEQILRQFSCIGQENMQYSKTWAGKSLQLCQNLFVSELRKHSKSRTQGSAIRDARQKAVLDQFAHAVISGLETYVSFTKKYPPSQLGRVMLRWNESSRKHALQNPSAERERESTVALSGPSSFMNEAFTACGFLPSEISSNALGREQIFTLLQRLKDHNLISPENRQRLQDLIVRFENTRDATEEELSLAGPATAAETLRSEKIDKKTFTFSLEEGHQPALIENLCSLYLPFGVVSRYGAIGAWTFGRYVPEPIKTGFYTAAAMTAVVDLFTLPHTFKSSTFGPNSISRFHPLSGLIHGRNQTMARNVIKTLTERPDEQALLAIVGSFHVDGIAELLKAENFVELDF